MNDGGARLGARPALHEAVGEGARVRAVRVLARAPGPATGVEVKQMKHGDSPDTWVIKNQPELTDELNL